ATEDFVGADAAVEGTLGGGIAVLGETQRTAAREERVLLLETDPHVALGAAGVEDLAELGALVGRVGGGAVGAEDFAEDQEVAFAADGVFDRADRLQNAVG